MKNIIEMKYEIENHPHFAEFISHRPYLIIDPVMVNPDTKCIEDDRSSNTELNFWVEVMVPNYINESNRPHYGYSKDVCMAHCSMCDSGGITYEDAIKNVWKLFCDNYGYTTVKECDDASLKAMNDYKHKYKSGIEIYIKDMYNVKCIDSDVKFLNLDELRNTLLEKNSLFKRNYLHLLYKNNVLESTYTSDSIVNVNNETYHCAFKEDENNISYKHMNEIFFRLFNVEYADILIDVKQKKIIFENIIMFKGS